MADWERPPSPGSQCAWKHSEEKSFTSHMLVTLLLIRCCFSSLFSPPSLSGLGESQLLISCTGVPSSPPEKVTAPADGAAGSEAWVGSLLRLLGCCPRLVGHASFVGCVYCQAMEEDLADHRN